MNIQVTKYLVFYDGEFVVDAEFLTLMKARNYINSIAISAEDWAKFSIWRATEVSKGKMRLTF